MKYIGPFLRINSINKENIKNQVFHLAKESIKDIVLNSKCGIHIPYKSFMKNIPNFDSNTKDSFFPLLCIYKKASPKLINKHNKLIWNENKFKAEVDINSNAFMSLCLLELADYYKKFESIDKDKFKLYKIYIELSKKQLDFYASYLRNHEGVFVNKTDVSDPLHDDYKFEETSKKFKFSNQAFLMAAYYKYSTMTDDDISEEYQTFSLDILKMLIEFREEIYLLSLNELNKICLALNLFYSYSKLDEAKMLLLDLIDLISNNYNDASKFMSENKLEFDLLLYLNEIYIYKNTKLMKFKEHSKKMFEKLFSLYDKNYGLIIKESDEKQIDFSSTEVILFLSMILIHCCKFDNDDEYEKAMANIFKEQIIHSGLVLSWPDVPTLDDPERYRDFSMKSEDLLEEQNFRLASAPTPISNELASIFVKRISFNRKKEEFKDSKLSFDSSKNMFIYFILIMLYKNL